ncbi:hypothetical protein [Spirillospora sp. CA-294931]|uniref:hypothetical protein n=1 Tax=Spirillospora sp. CA-294931 TaxID=3240042 RepID=UPI003D90DB3D
MNDHDGAPSGERDLVRSGLPQLVPGWGVRAHVLPRMLPGLAIFAGAVPPWFLVPDDAAAWVVLPMAGAVSGALTWFACRGLREHRRTLPRWAALALPAVFLAWPALAVFVFFTLLGVIAVDPGTARTWVGSEPAPSVIPGVPQALLRCATVLAAFGAANFAVSTMNDPVARGEFFRPIVDDLEAVLTRHARAAHRPPGAS